MSSDRERIIEFDASTSIPADGWFAIDSTTEGTRKIQKSAIIGSGSLDTTSQEVIGAINEVNARAATVESMTQAEYDALPDTKLSDNVVRYITDGEPTYDETLWNKVGEDPLDTTAQDCSGAINELNSALTNLHINPYSIITSQQVSTTEATYNTYDSRKFSDYDLLIFAFTNGTDDVRGTNVYPAIEWTSGKQIVFQTLHGSSASSASSYSVSGLIIKYNSDTSVKATGGGANLINRFRIFGVKLGVR